MYRFAAPLLVGVLTLAGVAGSTMRAPAAGTSKVITLAQTTDSSEVESDSSGTIAGAHYSSAILLVTNGAYITVSPPAFPGYNALTVSAGVADASVNAKTGTATLIVTIDGTVKKTIKKTAGQAATQLTIPFGHASQIKLSLQETTKDFLLLGNPMVVVLPPKAVATPPAFGSSGSTGKTPATGGTGGKTTLSLFSASVAAGGQETALITSGAGSMVTVVITYPGGTQQVFGPKKAGADGHYAYSWSVPSTVSGVVHVVVVGSSVAQASFTVR